MAAALGASKGQGHSRAAYANGWARRRAHAQQQHAADRVGDSPEVLDESEGGGVGGIDGQIDHVPRHVTLWRGGSGSG